MACNIFTSKVIKATSRTLELYKNLMPLEKAIILLEYSNTVCYIDTSYNTKQRVCVQ